MQPQGFQALRKGDLTQRDDDFHLLQEVKLSQKVRLAVLNFFWQGFIFGRSTSNRRSNIAIVQFEAVIPPKGVGLIGKTELIECVK